MLGWLVCSNLRSGMQALRMVGVLKQICDCIFVGSTSSGCARSGMLLDQPFAITGPEIKWRPGRTDYDDSDETKLPPDGRLPDASRDAKHIRDVFYRMVCDLYTWRQQVHSKLSSCKQMHYCARGAIAYVYALQGFNDQEIVALSGAHSMGRCHPDRSGCAPAACSLRMVHI